MLLTLIVFLAVLSLLVFVHEFGHFLAAKKFGIRVEEFGFGLPPRALSIKRGKTIYSINWLPIGGFVKLYGEDETEDRRQKTEDRNEAFFAKSKRARALVLVAGVVANFLLAIVVISYIFTQGVLVPTDKVFVKEIAPGSPAAMVGLKSGDVVAKIDGKIVKTPQELTSYTKQHLGEEVVLEIERCENRVTCHLSPITLTPRKEYPKDQGPMGIAISNLEERKYPWWKAPFLGTLEAFRLSGLMFLAVGDILVKLVTFQPITTEVAGPLGIVQVTGEAVKFGVMAVLQLIGLLSLNLAVVNILPFPALDGGRLLFVGIEAATGKKIKPRWERWTHQVGMAILLALIILVTINDLLRILRR